MVNHAEHFQHEISELFDQFLELMSTFHNYFVKV